MPFTSCLKLFHIVSPEAHGTRQGSGSRWLPCIKGTTICYFSSQFSAMLARIWLFLLFSLDPLLPTWANKDRQIAASLLPFPLIVPGIPVSKDNIQHPKVVIPPHFTDSPCQAPSAALSETLNHPRRNEKSLGRQPHRNSQLTLSPSQKVALIRKGSGTMGLVCSALTPYSCFPARYIQTATVKIQHNTFLHILIDKTFFWKKNASPKNLIVIPTRRALGIHSCFLVYKVRVGNWCILMVSR